jgi:hypothetical protein
MWSVISRLVLRLAAVRWFFKLGGFALLLPIAFLLKVVGLPLLAILMVLGMPILALLFLFGLPVFLVLLFGGMAMGLLGVVLTVGMAAVKFGLFVVLPIWLLWKLGCMVSRALFGRRGGGDSDRKPPTPDVPPPPPPPSSEPYTGPISEF